MATSSIYTSLLAAQKAMGPLLKNATNPHFRNTYADLSAVIETITEPLNNNGLMFYQSVTTKIEYAPDRSTVVPTLRTVIADTKSGETIESEFPIVCKDPQNPQAIGGAITYLRRYSLMAMLGLAPEDDDGHAASQKPERKPEPRKEPEQFVDTTTGEIERQYNEAWDKAHPKAAPKPFDETAEKNALMRGIMAAAKDLEYTNEMVKEEMWVAYGGNTPEAEFSRNQLSIDQMTAYRDQLNKRKRQKGIK